MDRNQAIGLTLMALVLLIYFIWFAPQPEPPPAGTDSLTVQAHTPAANQNITTTAPPADTLEAVVKPEEFTVETPDLKITFSNRGGVIRSLELKHYKTYHQAPLLLIDSIRHSFEMTASVNGKLTDLYSLMYSAEKQQRGDTILLTFTRQAEGKWLRFTYAIPPAGYEIGYTLDHRNFLDPEPVNLRWHGRLSLFERDLTDSRNYTTVVYRHNGSVDELPARSTSAEQETLTGNINWISVKQKFFLNALISEKGFSQAELKTSVNDADTSTVKLADLSAQIPADQLNSGQVKLSCYFGPNDYQTIGKVAPDFAKNVYLGWPPVYWINKFVIFPVFHFLTKILSNYGLIIIILVILLRIVLLPLSYRSYLSMAKMKVLKPELDEIKEKYGSDMAKVQQEQLKLYQQAGVNPLSGCIPILLQMPILFAMFYLFPNSIELRQQSFLWADDLSTYDSVINLPFTLPLYGSHVSLFTLLMTLSTLIITWQNNQISSVQGPMKSMSYIMPVVFMVVLNSFPAGLSFYYLMSNLVTFGQQAIIRRFVDEQKIKKIMDEHRKSMAMGTGKKSKFMARLEEAMKASEEARRKAEEERKRRKK
ncbi:MAG: membrane protein insertase YidC [Cyclobacteriaceae bacterium]|nr:MAG: membrane protein insertase YidC [Cyclobacteriaceae bacterium]